MSLDWRALREYGRSQIESGEEVAMRAGISRCYYACFHRALPRALAEGYRESPELGSHSGMWFTFRSIGRAAKGIFEAANEAKHERVKADYDLAATITRSDAERAYREMERLHALLDAIRVP